MDYRLAPRDYSTSRRRLQASLFDLANEKVIDELRTASDTLTSDEAKDLVRKLKDR